MMHVARSASFMLLAQQALAGSHEATPWTKKEGACRKNADGTGAGEASVDFSKFDKTRMEVTTVEHCQELCVGWMEAEGVACHGIEFVKKDDATDFDYCEFWITKPLGVAGDGHMCNILDGGTWTEQTGACRLDAAGETNGEKGTDFVKYDKAKDGAGLGSSHVKDIAKCKALCVGWAATTEGEECYGIEVKESGADDFDYCEIWTTKPEGTEAMDQHYCEVFDKMETEMDIGAKSVTANTAELDASPAVSQQTLAGFVTSACLWLVV